MHGGTSFPILPLIKTKWVSCIEHPFRGDCGRYSTIIGQGHIFAFHRSQMGTVWLAINGFVSRWSWWKRHWVWNWMCGIVPQPVSCICIDLYFCNPCVVWCLVTSSSTAGTR